MKDQQPRVGDAVWAVQRSRLSPQARPPPPSLPGALQAVKRKGLSQSGGGSDGRLVAISSCCETEARVDCLQEPLVRHFSGVTESSGAGVGAAGAALEHALREALKSGPPELCPHLFPGAQGVTVCSWEGTARS
uniref:Uncharacterized protein n=1 Tax=Molossus molossus TaxID=27622 RepID=A0A7J8B824_MOLMO|nr:hypothetical protein HJG59_010477 [Molossus molossus]